MQSVDVVWKGNCRKPEDRYRLLGYLHRVALVSDAYLRNGERPHLTVVGDDHTASSRPNIEVFDDTLQTQTFVSSTISAHPETLVARALEAGLTVTAPQEDGLQFIGLDGVRLRGLDFKLFDARGAHPENDRMSFVFMESPRHHFLDGRLVEVSRKGDAVYLSDPSVRLCSYLEDWTDCLFAWARFFLMGDLWWRRHEELQGYNDYRGVFEEFQTARGSAEAEDATFDAVLSTFSQHAEYRIGEAQDLAKSNKVFKA
jgi:hypothetical protein